MFMSTTLSYADIVKGISPQASSKLCQLPPELISLFTDTLSVPEMLNFTSTCKTFYRLLTDEKWKHYLQRDFPSIIPRFRESLDAKLYVAEYFIQKKDFLRLSTISNNEWNIYAYLAIKDMQIYQDSVFMLNWTGTIIQIGPQGSNKIIKCGTFTIETQVKSFIISQEMIYLVLRDGRTICSSADFTQAYQVNISHIDSIKQFIQHTFKQELYNVILQDQGTLWLISADEMKRWPIAQNVDSIYQWNSEILIARLIQGKNFTDLALGEIPPFLFHFGQGFLPDTVSLPTDNGAKTYPIKPSKIISKAASYLIAGKIN